MLRWILYSLAALLAVTGLAGGLWWQSLYRGMPDLPPTEALWTVGREAAVEFVTEDGTMLAIRGPRYGRAVTVETLPPHVSQAFIAAEDKRFHEHDGADERAMLRALWSNWRAGRTVSGASTITQQLVKNLVLGPEQTLRRKVQEARLARQLEMRLSKDAILELYLNRIYFGSGFYGLGAASQYYFGVEPQDLTLAEASLLASLPKAPSRLALSGNLAGARARQAYVLGEMVDAGFISEAQAVAAAEAPVDLTLPAVERSEFGHVLDHAAEILRSEHPDAPADLVVTLTIDPALQARAQEIVTTSIAEAGKALSVSEGAAIVLEPDGRVRALVGGVDYQTSAFNRATQALRQPGSVFKTFVYAAALEQGLTPYDVREDAPLKIGKWEPRNYGGDYLGPVTLSEALADSVNTVAASLGQEVTERDIILMARRLGITAELEPLPSIALGSQEVTLMELARAYLTLQQTGRRIEPWLIARIETSRGQLVYQHGPASPRPVYPEALARQLNGMLVRVVEDGTGGKARFGKWTIAGKTGTSQDWRDAWFVGFSGARVGAVWVGNDDNSPMAEVTGGGLPAEIWANVMAAAHQGEVPVALPGAEALIRLSEDAEARIAYYRALAGAFASVSEQRYANSLGQAERR